MPDSLDIAGPNKNALEERESVPAKRLQSEPLYKWKAFLSLSLSRFFPSLGRESGNDAA